MRPDLPNARPSCVAAWLRMQGLSVFLSVGSQTGSQAVQLGSYVRPLPGPESGLVRNGARLFVVVAPSVAPVLSL